MEPKSSPERKRLAEESFEALSRKRLKIDCNHEKNKTEDYEESSTYRNVNNDEKNKKNDEEHEEAKRNEELETEKAVKKYEESSPYRHRMVNNDKNIKKYDTETEDDKKDDEEKETEKTEEDEEAGISEEKNRKEEESYFLKLYTSTLEHVKFKNNVRNSDVKEAISSIIKSFNVNHEEGQTRYTFDAIDFDCWDNICGYLYRFGALGAGFARFRILNALKNCEKLKLAGHKNELRVICLGSGPGNDAIGFCSALAEFHCSDKLIITAVDKYKKWSLCIEVVKDILKKEDMGKVSELFHSKDVDFSFIQVDLPGDPEADKNYFRALAQADIIIMSKLLSILDFPRCRSIIKSLHKNMKKEALILLNDPFMDFLWKDYFKTLYSWGSEEKYSYESTAKAGYSSEFRSTDCTTSKPPITVLTKKEN